MNSIEAKLDKSDYKVYNDYLNFLVDEYWLDERIDELYPGNMYKGLIPTLLFWMEDEKESKVVWDRILPDVGYETICPILMCPDDADFSCTLIDVEIQNKGETIKWNRIGTDYTKSIAPEKVGSEIEWFDRVESLEFKIDEYKRMLKVFKDQFEIDKQKWEEKR